MFDLKLPWASSIGDNRKFFALTAMLMFVVLVFGVLIQQTELPEQSREELEKLPPQLAKVILKKKELPPPPKVEEKKPEPKPEEKKPEPKPEPKPEEKKPEPKPKEVTPERVQKAREKVKNEGVLAMKDDLASLRESFSSALPSGQLSKGGSQAATINRKTIAGSATTTSGGIKTAAVPSGSGVSGLQGRDITQVDSVALGGSMVSVDEQTEAVLKPQKEGQRSEEGIRAVVDANKGALFNIYNRALRSNPALQGRVTFELTIEPDGSVSGAKIVSSELNDKALENRLVMRIKMINFGAEKVDKIRTQYVIQFFPN